MLRSCTMGVMPLVVLGAAAALAQPTDDRDADPADVRSGVVEMPGAFQPRMVIAKKLIPRSEYWLGIRCFPVEPALRSHLNLPEGQGVLVVGVVPESPAAEAGMVKHDVLLRFGDRKLGRPRDLVEAVEAAKEQAEKLELVRRGKRLTVEVIPAKRPERLRGPVEKPAPRPADWETVQKWLERMAPGEAGEAGGPPLRFRFFHPGAIVPKDAITRKPMPENLSVIVRKQGDQPARIEVRRDDDKWELSENDLDKLPDDVRPFVERMLGGGFGAELGVMKSFDVVPDVMIPRGRFRMDAPFPRLDPRLKRHFDEMNRRLDRMMEMMERMSRAEDRRRPAENDD